MQNENKVCLKLCCNVRLARAGTGWMEVGRCFELDMVGGPSVGGRCRWCRYTRIIVFYLTRTYEQTAAAERTLSAWTRLSSDPFPFPVSVPARPFFPPVSPAQ
jgi:hypothetical protein